jgi:hypothetical protein
MNSIHGIFRIALPRFLCIIFTVAAAQQAVSADSAAAKAQGATALQRNNRGDLEDFLNARTRLLGEMEAVRRNPVNRTAASKHQALDEWRQRNAARFETLIEQAVRVAKSRPSAEIPMVREVTIPANASPELEEFLVEKARMYNERTRLENRLGRSSPEAAQAVREWETGNRERFAAQNERARAVAAQTSDKSIPIPLAPAIPRAASPELRAFITERHTLLRERAEALEQVKRLDPAARQQALAAWEQQNSTRFQELSQKARAISNQ